LTSGPLRGEVAFVGVRLLLSLALADLDGKALRGKDWPGDIWREALALLQECLHDVPDHVQALWCAAAVRAMTGDQSALAAQAAIMNRPDVNDARFHYLAAVCHLAAGDHASALGACERANADATLAVESAYLAGWACIQRRDPATAALAFQRVAQAADSPSAVYAQAILGAIRFHQGAYGEAVEWWQRMDPERRKALGFAEPLSGTVFLSAIDDYQTGRFEQAANKLREAGKLGLHDRRLGPLLSLSLFKAGQQMLYEVVA
jgi:tetratricopeptide (TPR) repeat protein